MENVVMGDLPVPNRAQGRAIARDLHEEKHCDRSVTSCRSQVATIFMAIRGLATGRTRRSVAAIRMRHATKHGTARVQALLSAAALLLAAPVQAQSPPAPAPSPS